MNNSAHNLHAEVDENSDRQTPSRHQIAFAVAEVYTRACDGEDVVELLHDLIVSLLEPRQREIYEWFCTPDESGAGESVYAIDVAHAFELDRRDVSIMLLYMVRLGLLERIEEKSKKGGRRFLYGLPGLKNSVFGNL